MTYEQTYHVFVDCVFKIGPFLPSFNWDDLPDAVQLPNLSNEIAQVKKKEFWKLYVQDQAKEIEWNSTNLRILHRVIFDCLSP